MKEYYTYIVECKDKSFYIGVTNNLERRIEEHNLGVYEFSSTFRRKPVKLVYFESTQNIQDATEREKQLKGWSRETKIALIKSEYGKLSKSSIN